MAKAISSVTSLTLDLPPSCIALCPTHPRFFAVGTYFLHPSVEKNGDSLAEQPAESFKKKDSAESAIDDEDDDNTGNEDHATADPQPQKRTGSLSLFDLDPETSEV
jgi:diphthamide biosynthesis protein 7